jgi:multiple antibiotic resistance protein
VKLVHLVFVGFVALFPPVNPVGTALIINPVLNGLTDKERKTAARRITFYCLMICVFATLTGSWIFKLFSISLPVVQMAGGILICKMGWEFLSSKSDSHPSNNTVTENKATNDLEHNLANVDDKLFYPLAFPMTTGAGTISVLLTLSAHGQNNELKTHLLNTSAILLAVFLMCALVYICYAFTPILIKKLGTRGEEVLNKLSAFLVFCVGIQIATSGIMHLVKP